MQYWTSVSIGVLIGAHLAGNRLNGYILAVFIFIYTLFTFQVISLIRLQVQAIKGIFTDLKVIADSGIVLSHTARNILESSPIENETLGGILVRLGMVVGIFLVTISYPIYCNRKSEN
jgi:hypothetical protein